MLQFKKFVQEDRRDQQKRYNKMLENKWWLLCTATIGCRED